MAGSNDRHIRYTLAMVVEMTGLSARQIRYYEGKGLFTPERSSGNQRLFSPSDLSVLQTVADLKKKGYSLTKVRTILAAREKNAQQRGTQIPSDRSAMQSALLYFKGGRGEGH